MGGEHRVQPGKCLAGAGEEYAAAYGAVEAMHHTQEHLPGLGVCLFDVCFHHVAKRAVACLVALDNLARRLVYDDDVVILVDDLHSVQRKKVK